jgi:hypothetical protein
VCSRMACPPLYQCASGHLLCSTCYKNASIVACPSCRVRLDKNAPIRNLMLERILEVSELQYPCQYDEQGCKETFLWGKEKETHEKDCGYRTFKCPFSACTSTICIPTLVEHFDKVHEEKQVGRTVYSMSADKGSWSPSLLGEFVVFSSANLSDFSAHVRHLKQDTMGRVPYRLVAEASRESCNLSRLSMKDLRFQSTPQKMPS